MSKKVVLAFSGGLDTSYCVKYLSEEKGMEIYSAIVNTGGFTKEELKEIEDKAYRLGVKQHVTLDVTEQYYHDCVKYLIFGNILKNNTYPLSVSAERVFQAMAIAKHVKAIKAEAVAHGSTGAGNDQVRFDMIFNILIPGVEIITPIRDKKLSREEEIEYLKAKGVVQDWTNLHIPSIKESGEPVWEEKKRLPLINIFRSPHFQHRLQNQDPKKLNLHLKKENSKK
jgi:argininosuccinate synthase